MENAGRRSAGGTDAASGDNQPWLSHCDGAAHLQRWLHIGLCMQALQACQKDEGQSFVERRASATTGELLGCTLWHMQCTACVRYHHSSPAAWWGGARAGRLDRAVARTQPAHWAGRWGTCTTSRRSTTRWEGQWKRRAAAGALAAASETVAAVSRPLTNPGFDHHPPSSLAHPVLES